MEIDRSLVPDWKKTEPLGSEQTAEIMNAFILIRLSE